jgi:primosomal protein N''
MTDEELLHREYEKLLRERIEELERKLNKAMGALEKVQAFVRDLEPHADRGHTLVPALREACETLAELKGETDA